MNVKNLKKIIQNGEKINVEFKLSKNSFPKTAYKSICSFNNRNGGHIILGVDDNKEIKGIDEKYLDLIIKEFVSALNNEEIIFPTIYLKPEIISVDGKKCIYIYVPEGMQVCQYKKVYWDRNYDGDINISKNQELIYKMFARKSKFSFVNTIYPALNMKHLDEKLIDRAKKMALLKTEDHIWKNMTNEEILRSTGLIQLDPNTGKTGITIACILLFGKDTTIFSVLPYYKTDAIFRIKNLDRYDDREVVSTNLLDSYDKLIKFGKKHLNDIFVLDGIQNVSARDRILREIISNTLSHRDYSSKYPAKFVIENNMMYTENSNLANGFGELDIKTFSPMPKNPAISKIFREIGLADELGSGMRNTNKYTRLYSNKNPSFIEGNLFKTNIPLEEIAIQKVDINQNILNDLLDSVKDEQSKIVVKYMLENKEIKTVEIEQLLNVKSSRARLILNNLVKKEIAEALGNNRNRTYILRKWR